MKLKFIIIFILFPAVLFSQSDNQGQSIELPDFVITGVQKVLIPTAKKPKPKLISTLSKEFITPSFSPESFTISGISTPTLPNINIDETKKVINGQLLVGAGLYTLPVGELNLSKSFSNALLFGSVWGLNEREYIDNAGYNVSGGLIKTNFFISNKSKFLPGLIISINGKYFQDIYRLYGSSTPTKERKTQNVLFSLGAANSQPKYFKYEFGLSARNINLNESDFSESLLKANAILQFNLNEFGVISKTEFRNQSLQNNLSSKNSYNFFSSDNRVVMKPIKNIIIDGGLYFAARGSISNIYPVGSIAVKFQNGFSVFAEYSPYIEFNTVRDFLDVNRFYILNADENSAVKYKNKLSGAIKYQYYHFVEISAGASYESIDNFFYFQDTSSANNFNIAFEDDVKRFSLFTNVMFHLGPFGYFYGDAAYYSTKNAASKFLPYNPEFVLSGTYGYDINSNFSIKTVLDFASRSYTNIENTTIISNNIEISFQLDYTLVNELKLFLDLNNLINRNNFIWKNYKQKPLDIVFGVDYSW
jgi:hypothetical protein